MNKSRFDIAIVGGGIGGSTLAHAMALHGSRVLVIERETRFRDRVRGEGLHAWGVPEARDLGVYQALVDGCGVEAPYWDLYLSSERFALRDFPAETPHGCPLMGFYHPDMQEILLAEAQTAGAEVWRNATVREVRGGKIPRVTVTRGDWASEIEARFVVGADGRNSPTRRWGGFETNQDPAERLFTGVLLENVEMREDTWIAHMDPLHGFETSVCSVGDGRARAYLGHPRSAGIRLAKAHDFPRFIDACVTAGAPRALYERTRVAGPMASFGCEDTWVDHPYKDGIALIGDAASTCDPSFGQGMAMGLRSVRLLRDELCANDDWDAAGHAYAVEQQRNFRSIRTIENWYRSMFLEQAGPQTRSVRRHCQTCRRSDEGPRSVRSGGRMHRRMNAHVSAFSGEI